MTPQTHIFADQQGVWREEYPGENEPVGILWSELLRVFAYKILSKTGSRIVVVLDYPWDDDGLDFDDGFLGFEEVLVTMAEALPGLEPDWFDRVRRMRVGDKPILLWTRN